MLSREDHAWNLTRSHGIPLDVPQNFFKNYGIQWDSIRTHKIYWIKYHSGYIPCTIQWNVKFWDESCRILGLKWDSRRNTRGRVKTSPLLVNAVVLVTTGTKNAPTGQFTMLERRGTLSVEMDSDPETEVMYQSAFSVLLNEQIATEQVLAPQ